MSRALSVASLPSAEPRQTARARTPAWAIEAALVAATIGVLLPGFGTLASRDAGRDARYATAVVSAEALPAPVLPALCATHGLAAEPIVRQRLCGRAVLPSPPTNVERAPRVLSGAAAQSTQALADGEGARGPACAIDALRNGAASRTDAEARASANAVLLLGAAIDGHAGVAALLDVVSLPDRRAASPDCTGLDLRRSIASTASSLANARASGALRAKDDAMRELLRSAGWQWAGLALLALALLHALRAGMAPAIGTALALAAWAFAAWLGRVPWPFGSGHALTFAREATMLAGPPAGFVVAMAAIAALLLAGSRWIRIPGEPSIAVSPLAYPGLVAATGIGWLVLLDLSAHGVHANRYLALYHQGHLWLGMLVLAIVACWRPWIGRALAWTLALAGGAAGRVTRRHGILGGALLVGIALLVTATLAALLANMRQMTSELGRLWLMAGAAWFFFLRGTPFTERVAQSGTSLASLARYTAPLLFVVGVLVAAMLLTHDMGPLLVAGYGAGAFVAASAAMWWYQRRGSAAPAYALAVVLFAAWIVATTVALFRLGAIDPVTAGRLENVAAPLASANDQLALVTWFQRAAPLTGYGPGAVPWCGFGASDACPGVPAQTQSDYTFTALTGMFGGLGAWAITLGVTLWLLAILRRHGRATRGEPRLVRVGGRMRSDEQAFLSWLAVAWVVLTLCQLAVTVAGNLAVIPLTGVTFPFVSFGMTSLVVNLALLALAIQVAPPRGSP